MTTTRLGRSRAIKAHADQTYGHEPYVVHLDKVVGILCEFGYTHKTHITAGYLHDTVEDTELTIEQIAKEFGITIAKAVGFVTDAEGASRKIRKKLTYSRMKGDVRLGRANADDVGFAWVKVGVTVKLADRIANVRTCIQEGSSFLRKYVAEHPIFQESLFVEEWVEHTVMWAELNRLIDSCKYYNNEAVRRRSGMRMFLPGDTNHMGKVFGGTLLCEIDLAGAWEAQQHTKHNVVTRSMKEVEFKRPVEVGDMVVFYTRLIKKGRTSITVHVEVEVERDNKSTVALTAAHVVYVAIDKDGNKTEI